VGIADEIASDWPCVGLVVGVVREGSVEFSTHGHADIATGTPATPDTAFRVASVTKTFTAVAVMQLWEQGLLDLDTPAQDYLRAYRLVPARPHHRPPTIHDLLTHTAGIREVLHPSGLLRLRDLGETVHWGQRVPSLATYYGGALRLDAEPGRRWMYTNHGFATLGQIVADVSGQPFAAYLREHVLDPLGLEHSDLERSDRVRARLATGYELRRSGARAVRDYDLIPAAAGGLYATPRDMAAYLSFLLGRGQSTVLKPETLARMFSPQYQPDPRLPGFGLSFFRTDLGGRLAVEHDGVLPGFDSQILVAPEDGVAMMAFANGARTGMHWLTPRVARVLRRILQLPEPEIRTDVPHHPEIWASLCGSYRFDCARLDPARFVMGGGAEVYVRRGGLRLRLLSPVPALRRGIALHPDDAGDPYVFRVRLPWLDIGATRVVFSREPSGRVGALHVDVGPLSFRRSS
jgi:CubicO group peptidase (beta-lactamase class C family)